MEKKNKNRVMQLLQCLNTQRICSQIKRQKDKGLVGAFAKYAELPACVLNMSVWKVPITLPPLLVLAAFSMLLITRDEELL